MKNPDWSVLRLQRFSFDLLKFEISRIPHDVRSHNDGRLTETSSALVSNLLTKKNAAAPRHGTCGNLQYEPNLW